MYPLLRAVLFRLDPERAHNLTVGLLRLAGGLAPIRVVLEARFRGPMHPVQAFGLSFTNPIGLAAGYDKDGLAWRGLACLGFGHIEVGTVTPLPQAGNPRPRLFRLPERQALINRMGFPGRGSDFVARWLEGNRPPGLVLGVNLGKNRDTPIEEAVNDYVVLLRKLARLADYLVINVSSPNTIGLRGLQASQELDGLLGALANERKEQELILNRPLPVLVKLAPDLTDVELDDALSAILLNGMDGVIVSNTTVSRQGIKSSLAGETGGLSGGPLREMSTKMVRLVHQRTGGKLPVIGVGGIRNTAGVLEKLDAGAVLVQLYTGLVYEGPGLVKRILSELSG